MIAKCLPLAIACLCLLGCGKPKQDDPKSVIEPTNQPANKLVEKLRNLPAQKPKPEISGDVIISAPQRKWDSSLPSVVGTIKNVSQRELTFVRIEFGIYDAQGNKVGTTFDQISSIAAGETWKYRATIDGEVGAPKLTKAYCIEGILYP